MLQADAESNWAHRTKESSPTSRDPDRRNLGFFHIRENWGGDRIDPNYEITFSALGVCQLCPRQGVEWVNRPTIRKFPIAEPTGKTVKRRLCQNSFSLILWKPLRKASPKNSFAFSRRTFGSTTYTTSFSNYKWGRAEGNNCFSNCCPQKMTQTAPTCF